MSALDTRIKVNLAEAFCAKKAAKMSEAIDWILNGTGGSGGTTRSSGTTGGGGTTGSGGSIGGTTDTGKGTGDGTRDHSGRSIEGPGIGKAALFDPTLWPD